MNEDTTLAESPVSVTVNGMTHTLRGGTSLAELLQRLDQPPDGTATAVNGDFVPRAARALRVLRAGDQVTCFQAIVGG